nr:adhesion G-protein coupled receptor G4 isoform X4 [Labrus bergylta]
MKSVRNLSCLAFCLSILLAVCLLGSAASDSNSLWGKKLKFIGRPCLWQLHPNTAVPALNELTVCILLRLELLTEWTGFDYKAPGQRSIELGLQGKGQKGSVWLFGRKVPLTKELKSDKWYSVCVTWSGRAQRLRVYIDGDKELEVSVAPLSPQHLAPNGTLTLGVSHYVLNSEVQEEDGKGLFGDIGLFRMWARERSAEEIKENNCSDGDVVSWDLRQWKYNCPPEPDSHLHCAWSLYKIKMWTFLDTSLKAGKCPMSLEEVARNWLENIFPPRISVREVFVSSPSRSCHGVNNFSALHVERPQASLASSACDNCFSCEVYVNVDPAVNVDVVQANITALLSGNYSSDFLNLTADPYSISVLPVESFPEVTKPTPTVITELPTSGEPTPTVITELTTSGEPTPTVITELTTSGEPTPTVTEFITELTTSGEPTPTVITELTTSGEPTPTVTEFITELTTSGEPTPTVITELTTSGEPTPTVTEFINELTTSGEPTPTVITELTTSGEPTPTVTELTTSGEPTPTAITELTTSGEPTPTAINELTTSGEPTPTVITELTTSGEPTPTVITELTTSGEPTPTVINELTTSGEPTPTVINELTTSGEPTPTVITELTTSGEPTPTVINELTTSGEPTPTVINELTTSGEPTPTVITELTTSGEPTPTVTELTTSGEPTPTVITELTTSGEPTPTVITELTTSGEPTPTVINELTTSGEPTPTVITELTTSGEPTPTVTTELATSVGPDLFFRVDLNLNITGSPTNPKGDITTWVKNQLEVNNSMIVLNLIIEEVNGRYMEQYNGHMILNGQQTQYNCTFHVQEFNMNSVENNKALIHAALTSKYENGSFTIQTIHLVIKHIVPENCLEETTFTIFGEYIWPEAFPEVTQEMGCKKPKSERASRLCKLDIETDRTSWSVPDMTNCKPIVTISDLENINVTTGNAEQVVDMIQDLVSNQLENNTELFSADLDTVVDKLGEVVDASVVIPAVGADIVNIVADILLSKTDITPVASIVLNLTERMGNKMDFQDESVNVTAPSLALSMVNVDPGDFRGLTFGVSCTSPILNPKIFVNQNFVSEPLPDTDATIALPPALHDLFLPGKDNKTRIQFQFYGTEKLFQDPDLNNGAQSSLALNSYIVSASVNGSHVHNLKDKVVVTLNHQKPKQQEFEVRCVFWDFQKNAGQGGWNSGGCETQSISSNQTSCLCDHLTHFAVLLDVSRRDLSDTDSQILTVISYLGCGISSIFLGITLLTYLAFEKLRRDNPSKILINLSAALLGLSMLFLLNSWLSSFSNYGLCIATGASLHYFLLASFTWMGLEAVHMYLALVKVFNIYIPSYILKFCAAGWGIPLVIVSIVLAIDKDAYGNATPEEAKVALQFTDQFCWLQNDVFFYVTVVAFFLLILLCNIFVFIKVLVQIRQMRFNKSSANSRTSLQDLRAVASLTVLLGLTWLMGFFSFGPGRVAMLYLFCIFNTSQGFFIFLFHCLMKENVRTQWRIHLCCGRFRPNNYSDWSRSATGGTGGRPKKNILVNTVSVASDNTTTRKVTDSSTGSAPNHHQRA